MFDLTDCRFAFLDLETTGLSPWFGDRICEIGIVLTEGKRILETFRTLVNPKRGLSPAAASINSLTDAELASAPPFEEVADELIAYLRDAVVVCHNARFDLQFLDSEYQQIGHTLEIPNLIDTLFIARECFAKPSNALRALAAAFGVTVDEERYALADALICRGLFFAMMDELQPPDGRPDEFIGIYNSPTSPEDTIQLPVTLSEAMQSGVRLHITYVDGRGERSNRWITPYNVIGLSDYLYLHAHCHLRKVERTFRLDRITALEVES